MGKRRRFGRSVAVLMLLAALLAAGWTGIWYGLSGRLADRVMDWERQQRAQGWTITHGAPRRTGWPMAAGVTLPGIAIAGGAQSLPGGVVWQAGSLKLAVDIRHLDKLYFSVNGRQTLRIASEPAIPFQATKFAGEMAFAEGNRPGLVQLHASALIAAFATPDGRPEPITVAALDAAMTTDVTANTNGNAVVLAATMTGLDLPPHLLPAPLRHLTSLSFDTALSGPIAVSVPVGNHAPAASASATDWRDAGGILALRAFHLEAGPLTLDGQGRFQLDAFLRPEGSVDVRATGVDVMTEALTRSGTLTRPAARAIEAVLGLMMRPAGTDVLDVPVRLRGGVVSLGAIPLLRLPLN